MVQDERLDLMKLGRIAMLWRLVLDLHPQKNLAVNQTVLKLIREAKCVDLNLNDLSIDDPETYEMLSRGQICGVFQVDSLQAANACRRIKPSRIQDIAALVAFNELGLEDSIALYAARKLGEVPVTYKHELLEPILRDTYGMIVYREQYVQAIELLAGYTRARADLFRRDNRKDDPLLMNLHRHSFVNGCSTKSNIPKNMAKLIIDDFNKASSHCFPKSYAVSVSIVAYQTAYLKAHYPFEFYSGLLEHHCDDPAYVLRIRDEMNSCGTGRTPFFGPEGELVSGVLLMV
jgi:DNA polymerase-3 subunit alpha